MVSRAHLPPEVGVEQQKAKADTEPRGAGSSKEVVLFFLALAALGGLMYHTWASESASGRPMSWVDFMLFFFREALIFGMAAIGMIAVAVAWMWRLFQRRSKRGENAL
jgi:hypothetical protein